MDRAVFGRSPAAFAAIAHLRPIPFPFFSPFERPLADRAYLLRQMSFFQVFSHNQKK